VITREMERPTIRAQLPELRHVTFSDGVDPAAAMAEVLAETARVGDHVGVEDGALFFPPSISSRVRTRLHDRVWHDSTALLSGLRTVKSALEIDTMVSAAAVSDTAMAAAVAAAGDGVSEAELSAAVHHAMYRAGGCQPGFAPLIRPLSMLDQEHVTWGDRPLRRGTGVFVELSGCVRRYHAPLSRTVYIGHAPEGAERAHTTALTGLHAAADALRPGVTTGQVYDAWQRATAGRELAGRPQRHHCGYLVGIGFPPSWVGGGEVLGIRPGGDVRIEPGMTFHLMSWVPGHVVSDTVLVTETGARLLTSSPRELTVVS